MLNFLNRSRAFLFLAFAIHCFCLNVSAQKKLPDIAVTIEANDFSLAALLEVISQKSGIPFSYNPKRIDADRKIDYSVSNKTLASILTDISEKFGLSFTFVEDQIILKPEKKSEKAVQTITMSGYVKDATTGEALIGSTVFLIELQAGTICNAFGFYSITVPKGTYTIDCSFVGYKQWTKNIDLNSSLAQDISLAEEPPLLKEIIVEASDEDTGKEI